MLAHLRTTEQGAVIVTEMMSDGLQRLHDVVSAAAGRATGAERGRLEKLQAGLQANIDSLKPE